MFPKSVLLIITGSVASYKSLELIRLLRARDVTVTAILTRGGAQFITPLAVSSLTGTKTYSDLFSLTDEVEMGHIELSRVADMILVAPASADILAKMAAGIADDLATTALLATNKPVVVAPAMNHKMWSHAATKRNVAQMKADGIRVIEPTEGDMACGEYGVGRMAEPTAIVDFLSGTRSGALAGKHAIVTSGATMEAIDPVRYLGNHSSGKQGHAIAAALAAQGARVTLISGNSAEANPAGVTTLRATDADAMLAAVTKALPADIFVGAAAVADWKLAKPATQKLKKKTAKDKLTLELTPTVDVLASIATQKKRPALVIGFAAETEKLLEHARAKRKAKNCDWIVANHVANGAVFGADDNKVTLVTARGEEAWKPMSKQEVAQKLVQKITEHFASTKPTATRLVKGKIA
jgi:phosphopantothenoylcysteine decarboxylase/phosphopantothenate--cysteine ligase